MKFLRSSLLSIALVLSVFSFFSCVKEDLNDDKSNAAGYVQFKLKKTQTKGAESFNYLYQAKKIRVNLKFDSEDIYLTLTLDASSSQAAEYGLRSQKIEALAGVYDVKSFQLYNGKDELIYSGGESGSFEIKKGGLTVHELYADVANVGHVKFTLEKFFSTTKAAIREYTFDEIAKADVLVKNSDIPNDNGISFNGLKASFDVHFTDDENGNNGYQTSTAVCDTILNLPFGNYFVAKYLIYDKEGDLLEINSNPKESKFTVDTDRDLVKASIYVTLEKAAAYLNDYIALKAIWDALDGPNWYYSGESYVLGSNWDFNKDIDLWGDQPGVSLHSNGRVAVLNLSDFGFRGKLPEEIGNLTEMIELYLGTHNDQNTTNFDPTVTPGNHSMDRMTAHKQYYKSLHPATPFSEPIARALLENNIVIPETEMYLSLPEEKVIDKQGNPVIKPMDMVHGKLCNGLTEIHPNIGKLQKLEKLFIANGPIETLPETMQNMSGLTDIEIYNCPKMTKFPLVLAQMPSLVALNLSNNKQWDESEVNNGFKAICNGAAQDKIEIWYMGWNNMTVFPKDINKLRKISLLDLGSNKISRIEGPLGTSVKFINLGLNNNQITDESWENFGPDDVFFGYDDLESLTFAHNKMKTLPNIFSNDLVMAIKSVDFSFNQLESIPDNFRGINVETLVLANNPNLGKLTDVFAKSESIISMLNLRACGLKQIDKNAFESENMINLVSLDLSYNLLSKLPNKMHAGNLPYLYGVDISYNCFSEFPYIPLDASGLTVFAIRGQRNNGQRCLKTWPEGIENHTGLRGLYLGSNDIRKVTGPISPLCYMLDISDNPNIIFDATDICKAIQNGEYILIYDKTQDIRNCPILFN